MSCLSNKSILWRILADTARLAWSARIAKASRCWGVDATLGPSCQGVTSSGRSSSAAVAVAAAVTGAVLAGWSAGKRPAALAAKPKSRAEQTIKAGQFTEDNSPIAALEHRWLVGLRALRKLPGIGNLSVILSVLEDLPKIHIVTNRPIVERLPHWVQANSNSTHRLKSAARRQFVFRPVNSSPARGRYR